MGTLSEVEGIVGIEGSSSKVRIQITPRKRHDDPVGIELSFTSDGFTGESFWFPTARVRGKFHVNKCKSLNLFIYIYFENYP